MNSVKIKVENERNIIFTSYNAETIESYMISVYYLLDPIIGTDLSFSPTTGTYVPCLWGQQRVICVKAASLVRVATGRHRLDQTEPDWTTSVQVW